ERSGDGCRAGMSGRNGEVPARAGARGAAPPPAGLREMSELHDDRAVESALTEALQRLPHRAAPARLVPRVAGGLPAPPAAPAPTATSRRRWWPGLVPALAAAAVVALATPVIVYQHNAATRVATATMLGEAIGNHLRIVQAQRPLEIESGDGHRVRPWFE